MVIELLNFNRNARIAVEAAIMNHQGMSNPDLPVIVTGSSLGMPNGSRQIIKVHDTDESRLNRTKDIFLELNLRQISGAPWSAIFSRAQWIVSEADEIPKKKEKSLAAVA